MSVRLVPYSIFLNRKRIRNEKYASFLIPYLIRNDTYFSFLIPYLYSNSPDADSLNADSSNVDSPNAFRQMPIDLMWIWQMPIQYTVSQHANSLNAN